METGSLGTACTTSHPPHPGRPTPMAQKLARFPQFPAGDDSAETVEMTDHRPLGPEVSVGGFHVPNVEGLMGQCQSNVT